MTKGLRADKKMRSGLVPPTSNENPRTRECFKEFFYCNYI